MQILALSFVLFQTQAISTEAEQAPQIAAIVVPADPFAQTVAPLSSQSQNTDEASAQTARGAQLLASGALLPAAQAYRSAIEAHPNYSQAWEGLYLSLATAQRPELASDSLVGLIRAYHANGRGDMANNRLNRLITVSPKHPQLETLNALLGRNLAAKSYDTTTLDRLRSLLGVVVLLLIAFAMSSHRRRIRWRIVLWGLGLQFIFGVLILRTGPGAFVFAKAKIAIEKILSFTDAGASIIFGSLYQGVSATGGTGPLSLVDGTTGEFVAIGKIFAFHILPTIIFFGALMSVLYHLGLVQRVVKVIAWVMQRTMGTSGSESLSAASNIFVGQTEAPLVIKPYVSKMTDSELMAVMVGGFATVAGGVLAAYVGFGLDAGHLLAASVMSAPAALVIAKIILPETRSPEESQGGLDFEAERLTTNVVEAAAVGTTDGLKLAANVGAMLIAFTALIAMINFGMGELGSLLGFEGITLTSIFGTIFAPLSWCMGVDAADMERFGMLLGTKLSINEFVAFIELGQAKAIMSPRSFTIATYALCGFANFSSIGIQIGGIAAIAPERRSDLARLGLRAMFGGAIASWLTACVAGILL